MPVFAVQLGGRSTPPHVLLMRHGLQMIWIHAPGIETKVIQLEVSSKLPCHAYVNHAVGQTAAPVEKHLSISTNVRPARPFPTISRLFDLGYYSVGEVLSNIFDDKHPNTVDTVDRVCQARI
jgi:hypothetical protein